MTTLREAAEMALEALEDMLGWESLAPQSVQDSSKQSLQRLREALAQPDPEPFGYFRSEPFGWTDCAETDDGAIPLYERPPQRQPLTDEEILSLLQRLDPQTRRLSEGVQAFARAIEQAHGIGEKE